MSEPPPADPDGPAPDPADRPETTGAHYDASLRLIRRRLADADRTAAPKPRWWWPVRRP